MKECLTRTASIVICVDEVDFFLTEEEDGTDINFTLCDAGNQK